MRAINIKIIFFYINYNYGRIFYDIQRHPKSVKAQIFIDHPRLLFFNTLYKVLFSIICAYDCQYVSLSLVLVNLFIYCLFFYIYISVKRSFLVPFFAHWEFRFTPRTYQIILTYLAYKYCRSLYWPFQKWLHKSGAFYIMDEYPHLCVMNCEHNRL